MRNISEYPILFSDAMVRAILDGRKTQTRRTVKASNSRVDDHHWNATKFSQLDFSGPAVVIDAGPDSASHKVARLIVPGRPPLGGSSHRVQPTWHLGMHLWVRESWTVDGDLYRVKRELENKAKDRKHGPFFRADRDPADAKRTWRAATQLSRWASRITLKITGMRVQRIQDISPEDCRAEGVGPDVSGNADHAGVRHRSDVRLEYQQLWEKINGSKAWNLNPWVWVFEFKRV